MLKKVLLFEGAGGDYAANELSDVCNYRIRTAFVNNDGVPVYFELGGHEVTKLGRKNVQPFWSLHVDHVFQLIGDCDENKTRISYDREQIREHIRYTKADIVKLVNYICNASFTEMEVLDEFEGYRVHADNRGYNLMDDHIVNRERTIARRKAYEEADKYFREKLGSKYSVISRLVMDDDSITIRCYASVQALQRVGMSEDDRVRVIPIKY